jgi:Tol biopolymer transport system component
MKKKYVFYGALMLLFGCSPKIMIDFLTVSVPEEGSLKLTQYSREDENIVHPYIGLDPTSGVLKWYAAPLLAVSPDGNKIAYIASSNGFNNLYLKDISGGRSIIQRTFNRDIMDMSYSPEGKYIVFTERKGGDDNIFMINATEGVAVQQLVNTSASELSPSFSVDGKNIFFAKSEGNRYFIWSLNIESSLLTQYTEGFTPNLSPNGDDLVVTRNSRDGSRGEIWMVNIQKGTETLILSDPKKGFSSPRLSPDGKKIICVGITVGDKTKPQNLDLFLINIDGTKLTQLTFHGGNDVSPVWSPDGKFIFFISQRGNKDGKYNVWKMDLSNQIK